METLKRAFSKSALLFSAVTSIVACASAAIPKTSDAPFKIELPAEPVVEGSVFYVTLASQEALQDIVGSFQGNLISFYPDVPTASDKREIAAEAGQHRYKALVGVSYGAPSGESPFVVRARKASETLEVKNGVQVLSGTFPSETLHVPPRTVTPNARDKRQIARDRALLKRAYASKVKTKFWDPPAVLPVESDITSVYGTSRVYNGKKQNVHLGTDLRARTGTPLLVPLTGKVVVARRLFYTGFTVVIDHGYGLFTIYGHLSKLRVKEGQLVKKGKVMGLAGATGRASGPHLHWGVHLHGAKVDPLTLVKALR